jgi:16S rRNA G966 N2-methylase RsmD
MENMNMVNNKQSHIDLNIITRIFPSTTLNNSDNSDSNNLGNPSNQVVSTELLQYDTEGLWSITLPTEADIISNIIKIESGSNIYIFDGNAGLGGNTISFAKNFMYVTSIELNTNRFNLLKNNINVYGFQNVNLINGNCLNYIDGEHAAYFFDPPWGGPDYKLNNKTNIKLGNNNLIDIINKIKIARYNKPVKVFIKLPNNYDLTEFNDFNYKINKIKNYILVTIY